MNLAIAPKPPAWISQDHWDEWVIGSGVDPGIVALNVRTVEDLNTNDYTHEADFPIARLLNWQVIVRFGQQVKPKLRGWWVRGVDHLNDFEAMEWGRFKPDADTPIIDRDKKKPVKYLSPKGTGSRLTLPDVPDRIWKRVADRYGIAVGDYKKFWEWVIRLNVPVILCEGEKKAAALLTLGYAAIALPGITTGTRSYDRLGNPLFRPKLIPDLEPFATEGREIYICFDYETKHKVIAAITKQTRKLCQCLGKAKAKPRVIALPGPQKGVDDFILAQGPEAFERCYNAALASDRWEVRTYAQLTFPAAVQVNVRYLNVTIPSTEKLVCIKSPKGTGKTESLIEIVREATREGRRVLLIGHRVQLVQAIADRVGVPYVTELRNAQEGSLLGYGLCIDSLHAESQARFSSDGWDDALVIIDECEQVVWHLLSADTEIARRRVAVLGELKELLTNVLESDRGQVVMLDADLSDTSIRFVQDLARNRVKPWIAINSWKPQEPWNVYNYEKQEHWFAALVQHIEEGNRVLISSHAQKPKSKYGTRNLEATLKQKFPDLKILCIDSWSIADPKHPANGCVSKLNEVLPHYDIAIASPSIETGVSIDIKKHFHSNWVWAGGVVAETSARQSMARLREPVDRHVYIAKYGQGRVDNGAISVQSLLASQHKKAKANIAQLRQITDFDGEAIVTNDAALATWAKMACRINAGMNRYREAVLEGLKEEGHLIHQAGIPEGVEELAELVTEVRDRQYSEFCQKPCDAEPITDKQAEDLKGKKNKTEDEWHQLRRHTLEKRYLVPCDAMLVMRDDEGWYPQIRLHYFLTLGRQFLQHRDKQAFDSAKGEGGELWLPTFNRSQLGAQVRIFDYFKIQLLLDPEREFRSTDEDLQRLAEVARTHAWEIKAALGFTIGEKDTPISIVQKFLKKLGLKLYCDRREGPRGARCRVYQYIAPADGRWEVYTKWLQRDQEALTRSESAVSTERLKSNNEAWTQQGVAV